MGRARQTLFLTSAAMIAFAANSLFCRLALKQTKIDPATFTSVRIVSGAAALSLIMWQRRTRASNQGSWLSALALFAYAAAFSFAYVTLSAGTGALLLFTAVQATMIIWGVKSGERLRLPQWLGLVLALVGLVALLFPGLSSPSPAGSILMSAAGVAWGIYSIRGKGGRDPLAATAGNFLRAVPFAILLSILFLSVRRFDRIGIVYAILSGAIASGVGYAIWYSALPGLKATSAAVVQLSVPVLAALAGVLFLAESVTWQLVIASICILGGIALVVTERKPASLPAPKPSS